MLEYIYHVMRRTEDPRMYRDSTEIQSSWPTYRDARIAAKSDLSQWSRDFWEEYEVTPEGADEYDSDDEEYDEDDNERTEFKVFDEDEGFRIEASSSEGEAFTVWIEKKEVLGKKKTSAPATTATSTAPQATKPLPNSTSLKQPAPNSDIVRPWPRVNPNIKATYRVMQWEQDNHNGGAEETTVKSTWNSYEEAVKAAEKVLLDQWDRDWFEQYQEEKNAEESGGFEVWARCPEGEVFRIYIDEQPIPTAPYTPVTKSVFTIVYERTGGSEVLRDYAVYESLLDANRAARALLVYEFCEIEYPNAKEPAEKHVEKMAKTIRNLKEKNAASQHEPYSGSTDIWTVQVKSMKIMPPSIAKPSVESAFRDGVPKRQAQAVIDIHDRPGKKQKRSVEQAVQDESDDEVIWL
ncbi:hypothetical protein QFC22_002109 [Naganishia vaughanmartiniae]|uniref:Uncharacterized protein n=1 Tax=Naganishia vaughanmartiniae TaxID=1424756 RepID=A0ACC2XBS7_9TREE|nr:hypothetical protein QFC22_002109 [Naganishia vaughanmartiniae]